MNEKLSVRDDFYNQIRAIETNGQEKLDLQIVEYEKKLASLYPHFNENEIRRTMPFNVDVYLDDDVITEEQENYDLRYNDKKDK